MNTIELKLPKLEGRYQLDKSASSIIKKADLILVSYQKNVPSECYLSVHHTKHFGKEEFEQTWKMGINVIDNAGNLDFRYAVYCDTKHVLQELVKIGSLIYFMPSIDEGMEKIKFMIRTGDKITRGDFAARAIDPKKTSRMVWERETQSV